MSEQVMNPATELKRFFGFSTFKGEQEEIVNNVLRGEDTFVVMPTGGGKSLCYQLPAIMLEGTAIVVSPLIALMKNQVDAIRGFSQQEGVAHVLNSSLTKREIVQVKEDLYSGTTRLLFVAPESLNKDDNIEMLAELNISFFAIDEAHCISEWGHDFRPEYRNLRSAIDKIGRKPIIALTATATPKVQSDIMKTLAIEDARVFQSSFNRPNLYYEVRPKLDVEKQVIRILRDHPGKSGIVYCLSRQKVEDLAQQLQVNGVNALPYHAGLDAAKRVRHQDAFLSEECDIIVATIAFGMGIDKPDVRFVIHHDMPKSLESYYQETGRAGRDGGIGNCITFYSHKDIEKLEKFLAKKPVAEQEIGKQLLQEAMSYAETSMCRRRYLLYYFGEKYEPENCGQCDNCLHPQELQDASGELLLVLQAVQKANQKFKAQQIVNIMIGNLTAILKNHNAEQLPMWGKGTHKDVRFWHNLIRQAVVQGYMDREIELYGVLRLSDEGKKFIDHPGEFKMPMERIYQETGSEGGAQAVALDTELYKILKDMCRKVAKEKGVPPYAVFMEPSLNEMATHYPCSIDELKNISGVGEGKAQKYGKPFIERIKAYVEENDINRPLDMVVKSLANKSALKVYLIKSTDRKLPLDDIARAKGLTMEELLKEMEMIVFSGTKLNIDYYLEGMLDDDSIEEVYEYFLEESQEGDIDAAYQEFDGDYTEEELRLIRLKFFSEVAN